MIGVPVDMHLAQDGYLRSFDGRIKYVENLAIIVRDTLTAGVRVFWVASAGLRDGRYSAESRSIYLAPWLFYAPPPFLRDVWIHELGHAVIGDDDQAVRTWQERLYREIVWPVWFRMAA